MKHKIIFSGQQIDLASNDIAKQLKDALSLYYPEEIVLLKSYKEVDDSTIEIEISRNYKGAAQQGLNHCINCEDMSIISGLSLSSFEPWGNPVIGCLIPWSDNMVYCPDKIFEELYIHQNRVMVHENIKRVDFLPTDYYIKITAEYA